MEQLQKDVKSIVLVTRNLSCIIQTKSHNKSSPNIHELLSALINKETEKGSLCNPDILLIHRGIRSQAKNTVFNTEAYLRNERGN